MIRIYFPVATRISNIAKPTQITKNDSYNFRGYKNIELAFNTLIITNIVIL
jgi:hypothetical protein